MRETLDVGSWSELVDGTDHVPGVIQLLDIPTKPGLQVEENPPFSSFVYQVFRLEKIEVVGGRVQGLRLVCEIAGDLRKGGPQTKTSHRPWSHTIEIEKDRTKPWSGMVEIPKLSSISTTRYPNGKFHVLGIGDRLRAEFNGDPRNILIRVHGTTVGKLTRKS